MIYQSIKAAVFIDRPNRFIAHVMLNSEICVCHVKNTGRCRELLVPMARVLIQECSSPTRKTAYDLIAVWKGDRLINMDASAPNRVFEEWAMGGSFQKGITLLKPESRFGDSRFDFYVEYEGHRAFIEVKGVTLEENGVVRFPDAPTERGVKHLRGLQESVRQGFDAFAVFIIQMHHVKYFEPNRQTHPEFEVALREAQRGGVQVLALDCVVTENSITADNYVEVRV